MNDLPDIAKSILNTLLDRAEQPDRRQVARVRLNERDHPGYFSPEDAEPRRAVNELLAQLARDHVLTLRWKRWEEGNWLEAVDLRPEGVAALQQLLGRTARTDQEAALQALVAAQIPLPGWHESFLVWAAERLAVHRSAPPLDREEPTYSADLLRALAALAALEAPTLERALSVRLFGNSKHLAGLRSGILRVLRTHDPEAHLYGADDDALLRAHHLDRAPEYVPLAGGLTLEVPAAGSVTAGSGRFVDLGVFRPSLALPAPLLRTAQVATVAAHAVITVENLTSFSEICALRPPDLLILYTGGFASPTVVALLRAIRAAAPQATFQHWGDLDAGGLRILAHLRTHLGTVGALAMNPATIETYGAAAQPLSGGDRSNLAELRSHPQLADCRDLIAHLLAVGVKLEQEAVPAEAVLVDAFLQ